MDNDIHALVNRLRRRNPRARTWKDYRFVLNRFNTVTGDKARHDVTVKDGDSFIIALVEHGLQADTINRHPAIVISFYRFLSEEDNAVTCPVLVKRQLLRKPDRLPPAAALTPMSFFLRRAKRPSKGGGRNV